MGNFFGRPAGRLALATLGLVAGLACDLSQIGQTITATPGATSSLALAVSPEFSHTPAASITVFPTATLDPRATAAAVNPCSLVTQDEATTAVGEPVMAPVPAGGACVFVDSSVGRYLLSAFAVPSSGTGPLIAGHLYLLSSYGIRSAAAALPNVQALGGQGDATGVVDSFLSLAVKPDGYTAEPVGKTGDRAIWVSKVLGTVRQGFLLAARGSDMVGVDIVVTYARDEKSVRDAAAYVVARIISRLPPRFVISIPTALSSPTLSPGSSPAASPGSTGVAASLSAAPSATRATGTRAVTATTRLEPAATATSAAPLTATLKPPAFSEPILAGDALIYGGNCGLSLMTFSITVADPSQVSAITSVQVHVRVVDPATGQTGAWNSLPMVADARSVWLGTLNSETQLPGHEEFGKALVEYYFSATNSNGGSAESPHYGVLSKPLTLSACSTPNP
jgi:hypothetical protein